MPSPSMRNGVSASEMTTASTWPAPLASVLRTSLADDPSSAMGAESSPGR